MAAPRGGRRLAAVMAADVAGYSRLVGRDEAGTIARLKALRREVLQPAVERHGGRTVKLMGDGALVEFGSAVSAVEAAIDIQRHLAGRDLDRATCERIRLRIGVNLGDVVIDGNDILGDGVNVAARLEALAEPGGVYISGNVFDQVRNRLAYAFEDLGEQSFKNIAERVRVHALRGDTLAALPLGEQSVQRRWSSRRVTTAIAAAVAAASVAAVWWWLLGARPSQDAAGTEAKTASASTSPDSSATISGVSGAAPPSLPRLSIVVLPFTNLSNDPEQEYFADGIVDDLTTDLSRIDGSFVIARNTAFAYKGRAIDAKQVGRELGVRYILEGSLRRTDNQVRINARLVDTATGADVWADRIEGDLSRPLELQDEITGRLARTLDLELITVESRRAQLERPNNPDAVDLSMRAWSVLNRPLAREQLAQAQDLFEQALRLDRNLPAAQVGLARTLAEQVWGHWSSAPTEQLARADNTVTQVLAAFPSDAMAHYVKGEILKGRKEFDAAIGEYEAAISDNRNLAPAYAAIGNAKTRIGRSEEAFAPLQAAIRLSPRDPQLSRWYFWVGHAYTHLAQDDAAIEWCTKSIAAGPIWIAYVDLASAYAWTGRAAEAKSAVAKLTELMPGYTVDRWAHEDWSDNPVFLAQYQRIIAGLRKAGLPES